MSTQNKKGLSGYIETPPVSLSERFGWSRGIVNKQFHAPSEHNPDTREDYKQEIAALNFLDRHRLQLPFSVPQVIKHGEYDDPSCCHPVAFIEMTKLRFPLDQKTVDGTSHAKWQKHAYQLGRVAAAFHQLPVTEDDLGLLKRHPYKRHLKFLREHPLADENEDIIAEAHELIELLEGESVFLHMDMHPFNVFTKKIGSPITGVCDFAHSGFGVKEMDFPLPHYSDFEPFKKGYIDAGGGEPNENNLKILDYISRVKTKLRADLEVRTQRQKIQSQQNAPKISVRCEEFRA